MNLGKRSRPSSDEIPRRERALNDRGLTQPEEVIAALTRNGVDFVLIGGIAVIANGHTRNTRDIDFVADTTLENLSRLTVALREINAELSGVDAHLLGVDIFDPETLASGANFTFITDVGGVDFFNEVPGGLPYEELRERALELDLFGHHVRVAGRDDLIRMKRAAGRPRDLQDIAALTDPGDPRVGPAGQ